jgi:hypothetical protein
MTKPKHQPIRPDPQDYEAVERQYGKLSENTSIKEQADRYRLAEVTKLIRLYGPGRTKPKPPNEAGHDEAPTSIRKIDAFQSSDAPRTFARHDDEPPRRRLDLRSTEIRRCLRDFAAFAADLRYRASPEEILAALPEEQRADAIETARAIAEYFSALSRGAAGGKPTLVAASSPGDKDAR